MWIWTRKVSGRLWPRVWPIRRAPFSYVICTRNGRDVPLTRNKADYGGRPEALDPAEAIERIKTAGT